MGLLLIGILVGVDAAASSVRGLVEARAGGVPGRGIFDRARGVVSKGIFVAGLVISLEDGGCGRRDGRGVRGSF